MTEYCKTIFETDTQDYYCIWYSDLNSGFMKEKDHIVCFKEEDVLEGYCRAKGYSLSNDERVFNLPMLMSFASGEEENLAPGLILDFWNICSDLAITSGADFIGNDENDALDELYDTLFLIIEDPKSKFTEDDIEDLKTLVKEGCTLIVEQLFAL